MPSPGDMRACMTGQPARVQAYWNRPHRWMSCHNSTMCTCNFDLHSHSTCSDGTLSPEALVQRARRFGVTVLALTDHDTLDGLPDAAAEAARQGIAFVNGVEVSASWGGETIHVVGLRVDPGSKVLLAGLARNRNGRLGRGREIADALAAAGVPGAYEGAMRHAPTPALLARSHFARFLVEAGHCSNVQQVFEHWLVPGKPGFVPHRWAALAEAVGWIRAAGGQAVLAHPGRYRLDDTALWALAEDFVAAGGEGIEVACGGHDAADVQRFALWCQRLGLAASRGSDFHGPGESRVELGQVAPLPPGLVPIWANWPDLLQNGSR